MHSPPFNLAKFQESLASVKLQSEFEIKHYEEELAVVAATHSADEVAMTSTMMTLQTEKAKLLDEQSAQQLQNDAIILNLDNELRKIKQLSGYANDMEVIDMSNPGRNSTQQFRNKNYNSMNCIVQLPNHADIPNNEFRIRTHQSVVNNVEVINLVSPVRNSTQQYPNETHNTNNVTLQNDAVIPSNEYLVPTPQNYIIGVEAVNLTSDMRNSQPFQNAIPEEKVYLNQNICVCVMIIIIIYRMQAKLLCIIRCIRHLGLMSAVLHNLRIYRLLDMKKR